jgi:glycosyltransferase involved in cell wall biosynthesis
VHNGVDPARFVRRADWRAETRRRWGVPDDAVVLGSVARLARVKGHAVSIRALARAQPTSARPLRLVLVGDGPEGDALRALARDAGVADHVIFAGASSESWKAYSGIDLLLMPSIREGLPLALLEAMAAGCVPIATAVGGIPEVLTSAELGWLVPAGDAAAFEAAVRAAVACAPDELERRAVNARAHVVARFDERRQIAELANRLESLCGGAPCPAPSESAANNS